MIEKQYISKKIIVFLLSTAITCSLISSAYADNTAIKLDGVEQNLTQPLENDKGYTMVDGAELAKLLKLKSEWNAAGKVLILSSATKTIRFQDGFNTFSINGESRMLPVAVRTGEKTLMLPLRQVCEAFGGKVSWDAASQTVAIIMGGSDISALTQLEIKPNGAEQMTYDEALKKAIAKNSSLKGLLDSISFNEEQYKNLTDTFKDSVNSQTDPQTGNESDRTYVNWLTSMSQLQGSMTATSVEEKYLKESAEYMLRKNIGDIKTSELDIVALKENIALAQENLQNLTLKQSVGMASENSLKKAKQDMEQLKISLNAAEIGLNSQRLALNNLLGLTPNQLISIDFSPKIVDVNVSLEAYITAQTDEAKTIKDLNETLRQAEYTLYTTKNFLGYEDVDIVRAQNAVNAASRSLNDAKSNLDKTFRSTYNELNRLKENDVSLKLELQKAKDAYQNAIASYDAGLVIMYEVNQAKLAILKAEIDIQKNVNAFDILYYTFQRPSLL